MLQEQLNRYVVIKKGLAGTVSVKETAEKAGPG